MFGPGALYSTTPIVNRTIQIHVLDNAIVVEHDGALNVFKDVAAAHDHLEQAVKTKAEKIKTALKPAGGSLGDIASVIDGISSSLGIPKELIKDKIMSTLGVEPWQTGSSESDDDADEE